jgi:hypothetical protein
LTADKLIENTSAATHNVARTHLWVNGTTYTASIFAKAGERTRIQIAFPGAEFSNAYANFDLVGGTVSASNLTTPCIVHVGNGIYRCSAAATAIAGAITSVGFVLITAGDASRFASYTGDGYSGIYIWGAQLEAGAFPTSYIKTEASQVTRSADSASITGANFTPWYRADEGTLYAEVFSFKKGSGASGWCVAANLNDDGTAYANDVLLRAGSHQYVSLNGSTSSFTTIPVVDQSNKIAIAYLGGSNAASINGANQTSGTPINAPAGINRLQIGNSRNGSSPLNGHLKKISYYPKRLSNAELQALTA